MWGRAGNDLIVNLTDLPATLHGGAGNDTIIGGFGQDLIFGGAGDDDLSGGWGNDVIVGGTGRDYISGSSGHDILFAEDIASEVVVDDLVDMLLDWSSSRTADEDAADELVDGLLGSSDRLSGGSGSDWFIVSQGDQTDFKKKNRDGDKLTLV